MDLRYDLLLLLLVISLLICERKQLSELICRLKQLRHEKVEQGPEFFYLILQRRARQQDTATSVELPKVL